MPHPRNKKKFKSKKYLQWLHDYYKPVLVHHVYHAKYNDLLAIPIFDRNEHDLIHNKGEKKAQEIFNKNYEWELINTLIDFIKDQFGGHK